MEITQVQTHIKQVLTDLAGNTAPETQLVFDESRGHYLYLRCAWEQMTRHYDVYVHIDILDGLVWVQRDRTDYGVVDELLRLGVPKDRIVLGFQAPYKRKYSGFVSLDEVATD